MTRAEFVAALVPELQERMGLPQYTFLWVKFHDDPEGLTEFAGRLWDQARALASQSQQAVNEFIKGNPAFWATAKRLGCTATTDLRKQLLA